MAEDRQPRLTVVLVCHDMPREIPRTVRSLSDALQHGIAPGDVEILLVDNGSTRTFDEVAVRALAANLRVIRIEGAGPSPVAAINRGLAEARGALVGVWIDGARLASPGLLAAALSASAGDARAVVGTVGFHLGPDLQQRSVAAGYDAAAEDALLERIGWPDDGYRLFDIAVLAGSSRDGWFVLPAESNAVFMRRELWCELGGYDERFLSPGGGLANLDLWARACALPASRVLMLLGEGTFHQVHGGVSTNAPVSRWPEFHEEYRGIRGADYRRPAVPLSFYGSLDRLGAAALSESLGRLERYRSAQPTPP